MRLCKIMFYFTLGILVLTTICFTASETTTDERYECSRPGKDVLQLDCSQQPGHVATGFIYGGNTGRTPQEKKKTCDPPDPQKDCQAPTISGRLREAIQRCLWRKPTCRFAISGNHLAHPCFAQKANYLVAKQFKCVKQSSVIDICSKSGKDSRILIKDSDVYLLSKNFPEIVRPKLNCSVTIEARPGVRLQFASLLMNIHPKTRTDPGQESSCTFDYVQMKSLTGQNPRFCGNAAVDFVSNATTEVQFVSGPDIKHYEGFVIRVTAVVGDGDIVEPESNGADVARNAARKVADDKNTKNVSRNQKTVKKSNNSKEITK